MRDRPAGALPGRARWHAGSAAEELAAHLAGGAQSVQVVLVSDTAGGHGGKRSWEVGAWRPGKDGDVKQASTGWVREARRLTDLVSDGRVFVGPLRFPEGRCWQGAPDACSLGLARPLWHWWIWQWALRRGRKMEGSEDAREGVLMSAPSRSCAPDAAQPPERLACSRGRPEAGSR